MEAATADIRSEVHQEIDRMTKKELLALKQFLATFPDRVGAMLRNAPVDDEPVTEEDLRAIAESEEWFRQNGGKGIPHDQVVRELGLE